MAEALKMDKREMIEIFENGMQSVKMNYYPPCLKPELFVGLRPHADASGITVLKQVNCVNGLDVKRTGRGFRLEKLGWRTAAGKAKVLGTLVGLRGAMILTFYEGPQSNLSTNVDLLQESQTPGHVAPTHKSGQMVLGSLLSLGSCICYAVWLILQAKMAERYPCPYSTTALMVFFGSFQGVIFAICTQRNWSQWQLGWNMRLLTVAYTIMEYGMAITFYITRPQLIEEKEQERPHQALLIATPQL